MHLFFFAKILTFILANQGGFIHVPEALQELREVRAIPVKIRDRTVWTRTDITGNAAKLFQAAKVKIPSKILKL